MFNKNFVTIFNKMFKTNLLMNYMICSMMPLHILKLRNLLETKARKNSFSLKARLRTCRKLKIQTKQPNKI